MKWLWVLVLAAGAASADGTADEADLEFRLGTIEFQRGNYEGALAHFFVSNRVAPNRNVLFNIGSAFERLHRYADAHRYYFDAADGETEPAALAADKAALERIAPRVALLDVKADPAGATIYIDRKSLGSVGRAPRLLAVQPGTYTVIAEADGYESASAANIKASLGKTTPVGLALKRVVGSVHVKLQGAPSVTVHVDDERAPAACVAPCDLQLPPGEHQLFFVTEGMRAAPAVVLVQAGGQTSATAQLAPVVGSILIDADEPRALIEIDGRPAGFTPAVVRDVAVGVRKVRVSLRGFEPVELNINVEPDVQAAPPQVSLAPLHEVEAVSRYAQDEDDAPSSVTLISREEIQAFGYPTLAEALRGVRGFTISDDHAYASASVRGLGQPEDYGNRLLVLQEGASLNDDIDNASDIGENGRVDLADIQRIEVVRGPGSLLYGAGAMSGVVNVITRAHDGADTVEAGGGVFEGTALHGRGAFQKNFGGANLWGSVSYANSDGFDLNIPGAGTANGVDRFTAVNTEGRFTDGALTAQWFFNRRNQSVPVGAYGTIFNDPNTRLLDTRALGEIRFEPKLTDSVQLLLRVHANRYASDEAFASDPAASERYEGVWYGAEARLIWDLKLLRLTIGGEGQTHPVVILHGQSEGTPYLDEHAPYHFTAGYLMADARLGSKVSLNLGARVDNYSTFGAIVVPRGALIFKPWSGATLKVIGGRAFRAPSIYELTYSDGGSTQAKATTLDPESIWSGEFEFTQRFATDWAALVGAHLARAQDLISAQPDAPDSAVLRFQNGATPVLLGGADFEIRRELRRQWMLSAAYEYQVAQYIDSSLADNSLVNAPAHLASAKLLAPILNTAMLLGVRATVEAPRRISLAASDTTGTSLLLDTTISGSFGKDASFHYVFGIYNLADQKALVPVSETFASQVMPQNGRTLLFQLDGKY